MSTYVIGDVQGCDVSLEALVAQLRIRPKTDRLWFVGDLVNRGPGSLQVLRWLSRSGPAVDAVLGNHDLHLLAVSVGARRPSASDTIEPILQAPDREELLAWLRQRPLAIAHDKNLIVHAGVHPDWSMADTLGYADEVSRRLQSQHWVDFLHELYGDSPAHWRDGLRGVARLRTIVNVLTRLRYLGPNKTLEMKPKMSPAKAPAPLVPWFDHPQRKTQRQTLVVGHWSTLGLVMRPDLIALDSGCVWRGYLSAVRLEDRRLVQQLALEA